MLSKFDPDFGDAIFQGAVTTFECIDPAAPQQPNLVLDPTKSFEVKVEWELEGVSAPVYVDALDGPWHITVYAESVGPGNNVMLAHGVEPKSGLGYSYTLTVPANTLPESTSGTDSSGLYRLSCTIFLNSTIPGGQDIAGFAEGPMIHMENPV